MENPQLENGYTRIANEIMDALMRIRIPGEQTQCLLFILRQTYGYNRKTARISMPEFMEATGLKRQYVYRALKSLNEKRIIRINNDSKKHKVYGINKDYSKWGEIKKRINNDSKPEINTYNNNVIDIKGINNGSEPIMVPKGINNGSYYINKEKRKYIVEFDDSTPPPKKEKIPYKEIIEYLNQKTNSSFQAKTKKTQRSIKARWNEGFRTEDFKAVIDVKADQWMADSKMVAYLRPDTLFSGKFEGYLQESKRGGTQEYTVEMEPLRI